MQPGDIVEYVYEDFPPALGAIGHIEQWLPLQEAWSVRWTWPPPNHMMDRSGEPEDNLRVLIPKGAL
jgi:hypothetical protein